MSSNIISKWVRLSNPIGRKCVTSGPIGRRCVTWVSPSIIRLDGAVCHAPVRWPSTWFVRTAGCYATPWWRDRGRGRRGPALGSSWAARWRGVTDRWGCGNRCLSHASHEHRWSYTDNNRLESILPQSHSSPSKGQQSHELHPIEGSINSPMNSTPSKGQQCLTSTPLKCFVIITSNLK